jgi:tRNA1(Val) A37 N6-methylase TrmN6
LVSSARRFRGWTSPGPAPPGGPEPEAGETLDALAGDFKIFQLERGHRYSTDDLLVAWWGTSLAGRVERALDLGSGIGSVALLAAWRLPGARFVTVEAQEQSLRLARKSVRYDGLEDRFTLLHGDLRDATVLAGEAPFDLVLGSPPYHPTGTAVPARHPQAVPARMEVFGDVGDYARAAARHLAPGGLFACVHPWERAAETDAALAAAGLALVRSRAVVFLEGEPPRVRLTAAMPAADVPQELPRGYAEPPLTIRLRDGARSPEYAAVRLTMGFPPL